MTTAAAATGTVAQVIGTVVDVEFPTDRLPALYNAIEIQSDGQKIVAEVEQHLGNNWVRCLAMTTTDGLRRGAPAIDTGAPITVPIGPHTLGRLFNVLGVPLDKRGDVPRDRTASIHRKPPAFDEPAFLAEIDTVHYRDCDSVAKLEAAYSKHAPTIEKQLSAEGRKKAQGLYLTHENRIIEAATTGE